jgi:hypothetical protein
MKCSRVVLSCRHLLLCLALALAACSAPEDVTDEGEFLEEGFRNPPAGAMPYAWWHWMNGNVTREGITADLEAMAEAGIGGALIFDLAGPHHNCSTPPARPVTSVPPGWR